MFVWFANTHVCDLTCFNNAESLNADKQAPEEETLSVLDVPPGKMGCIIGKRGANILAIKEGCRYNLPWDKLIICQFCYIPDGIRCLSCQCAVYNILVPLWYGSTSVTE